MRAVNLASSSDGNITYIESDSAKILVDIGLSCRETEKRIALLGLVGTDIDAIFITHEHSDHIKGLEVFAHKFHTKVFACHDGIDAIKSKLKKPENVEFQEFFLKPFMFKDMLVSAVKIPHDSVCCVGYSFTQNDKKISILTDLGQVNSEIFENIKGSQLVYLEANHNVDLLRKNPKYPASLKSRILSNHGHLSNIACADCISKLASTGTRQVVLAHLSPENNSPELAYSEVTERLKEYGIIEGKHIKIDIATQMPGKIFRIK